MSTSSNGMKKLYKKTLLSGLGFYEGEDKVTAIASE